MMGDHNRLFYGPIHKKHEKNNNVDEFIMLKNLFFLISRAILQSLINSNVKFY